MRRYFNTKQSAFTIVELLIVIIVIGILATLVLVAYTNINQQAKISVLQGDLTQASKQLGIDKERSGGTSYPATLALANNGGGITPSSGATYTYYPNNGNASTYCLEETKDGVTYYIAGGKGSTGGATQGSCIDAYGIVGEWNLNSSGNDSGPNGLNGIIQGATPSAGQSSGGGYTFTTGNYITLSNSSFFNTAEITQVAWVKPTAQTGSQRGILAKEAQYKCRLDTAGNISYLIGATGSGWTTNYTTTGTLVTAGAWNHVACVASSADRILRIYLNGVQIGTASISPITSYNTNAMFIGSHNTAGAEAMIGSMDDARIYSRALTAAEIQALYTAGAQ